MSDYPYIDLFNDIAEIEEILESIAGNLDLGCDDEGHPVSNPTADAVENWAKRVIAFMDETLPDEIKKGFKAEQDQLNRDEDAADANSW